MDKGIELTLRANGEGTSATNNSTDPRSASVDNSNPTTIEVEKCLFYILYKADNEYRESEFYKRRMHSQQESNDDDSNIQWEPVDDEGWSEFFEIFKKKQSVVGGFDDYPDNYVKYLAQKILSTLDLSRDKSQTKLSTTYNGDINQPLNLIDEAALRFKELNDKNDTPVLYFNFKGFDLNNSEDFRNCLKAQLVIAAKCDMLYGTGVKIQFQVDEKNIFQSLSNSHTPEEAVELAKELAENPGSFNYDIEGYGSYQELFENDEIEGDLKDIFEGQGLEEPVGLTKLSGMGNGLL